VKGSRQAWRVQGKAAARQGMRRGPSKAASASALLIRPFPYARPIRASWMNDNCPSARSARSVEPRPRRRSRDPRCDRRLSRNLALRADTGTQVSCRQPRPPSVAPPLNIGPAAMDAAPIWRRGFAGTCRAAP